MVTTKAPDDWAAAVADGEAVDWAALAAGAVTARERRQIGRFALLARIAGVHADASRDAPEDEASRLAPDYRTGDTWGNLRIVARLASGTFGTVYRAHDSALSRDVALKILHLPAHTPGLASEALREGRLLARVRHPNVVAVYGADGHDGRVGLWMELIEGRTLEEELERRAMFAPPDAVTAAQTLASALQAVHEAGLVHRDLKMQNVMIEARTGRLVLMDFSAGRDGGDSALVGKLPASIVGSPMYLAPECLDGAPASVRSDLYSLGVIVYRLITARYPVDGATFDDLLLAHRRRTSLVDQGAALPPPLGPWLRQLLSVDPDDRPPSALAAAHVLRTGFDRPSAGLGRRGAWRSAVATIAVVGVLVTAYGSGERSEGPPPSGTRSVLSVSSRSLDARAAFQRAHDRLLRHDVNPRADARATLALVDEDLAAATTADPSFALAYAFRALTAARPGDQAAVSQQFAERALFFSAGASVEERAFIEGVAYRLQADRLPDRRDQLQSAARAFETVLRSVPAHYWTLVDLHRVYERLQQFDDADRVAIAAARHQPDSLRVAIAAATAYLRRGDGASLERLARRVTASITLRVSERPNQAVSDLAWLALWPVRLAWMSGDGTRTSAALDRVAAAEASNPNPMLQLNLAHAAVGIGRFAQARALANRIADQRMRTWLLTLIDVRQERWADPSILPRPADPRFSFMYLMAGRVDEGERLLPQVRATQGRTNWQAAREFEAHLRVKQGRFTEALALFAPLLDDERGPRLAMQEQVAIARRGTGDMGGAVTVLERFEREPVLVHVGTFAGHDWLRCVLRLAEYYREQGRLDDSRRVAAKVRAMLARADADHPFVARLAQLP